MKNLNIDLVIALPRKSKLIFQNINKRHNKRHLTAYLDRKLSIYRESNYKIRRTLLLRNVYLDGVHLSTHGNIDHFNTGLVMYLVSLECQQQGHLVVEF